MIVLTRFADTNQVHRVDFAGGARSQVSFHPERVTGAQTRPGHPEVLFEADEGGAENYQLYLIPQTSGEAVRLSDGRSRNMGPRWSPSGKLLAFSSNARNGRDMDLYVADPSQPGQARLFKEVSGSWTIEDWSPEESRVVAIEYVSINESYVHIVEIGTGKTTFIRAMLRSLGVHSAIKSPTFSLVESYQAGPLQIHHFDLYRIHDEAELDYIGFRDYFADNAVCCIEWPERATGYLTEADLDFALRLKGAGREMQIHAFSPAGAAVLSCLAGEK